MSWTAAKNAFAEALPGYESRLEQDRLATTIEDHLADGRALLAEAGCGTGKSFAYLIPLAFRSRETGKPSVVATATKALQAQIANNDGPFLQTVFPWLRLAVVKGRGNYVCQAKVNSKQTPDVPALHAVLTELAENPDHTGDFDDLRTEIRPQDRSLLGVVGEECPGKRECPFGETCFAERAKAAAQDAHVVVVNHSVLMRDTEIKLLSNGTAGMLPHYGALAVDEAHELEEYATSALGVEFGQRGLDRLGDDVVVFLKDKDASTDLRRASRVLFERLTQVMGNTRDNTLRLTDELMMEVFSELEAVLKATSGLLDAVRADRPEDDDRALAKKRIQRRVEGMQKRLFRVIMADGTEIVRWIERETRVFRGQKEVTIKLAFAPLHVGEYMRNHVWANVPPVLVSATLATGDRGFDYIAERLGVDDFDGFDAGSPFDFSRQSRVYIPKPKVLGGTFPNEPKDDSWGGRMIAEAGELIRAAGGRTLFAFTSRRSMDQAYEALLPTLRAMGLLVLRQGDAPTGQLAETFKANETAVLFGLKSFMTGFDAQGDTLRLVILDKMPFPVPSDVIYAARAEAIDAVKTGWSSGSFMMLSIPLMVLTFLQAFGRLIRTKQDEGLVAIFDPRLWSKPYGKGILRALPEAGRIDNFAAAKAYLDELTARRG
jgi:ATP-dependent DNA helicase DinG